MWTCPRGSPLGLHRLSIYLLRGGKVVRRQEQTLVVQEVHLQHWLSHAARTHGWIFGAVFTLGMVILGLGLGVALRPSRNA